jgi:sec-independent protein translocase protein TatC
MQIPHALGPVRWRPIAHDEQLSAVGHLDELRSRLIVSMAVVAVAFGLCFWQNAAILRFIDQPLAHQTQAQVRAGEGPLGASYRVQLSARDVARQLSTLTAVVAAQTRSPRSAGELAAVQAHLSRDVAQLSAAPTGDRPVTLGIGEPFTATVTVTLIFALILSLPVLLLQAYGFLMPAFEEPMRRRMRPIVAAIPLLFVIGVAFGYEVVLPASLHFFENFNSGQFNVLVQASQYYKFAATVLLAMGLLFQIPVAIIAVTRAGLITPHQLRRHRRYAVLGCGAIAALLPGDAITMLLETLPLYFLYEASVLVATLAAHREARAQRRTQATDLTPDRPATEPLV